ncbi:HAD-IA family hydrolase [Candidatus Woesearchaeota archaeon]|nr:HAD-IA family hydrolase [Candidatus Woesearchaeota archaeon]
MVTTLEGVLLDWHGVLDRRRFLDIVLALSRMKSMPPDQIKEQLQQDKKAYATGALQPEQFWKKLQQTYALTNGALEELQQHFLKVEKNEELWNILPYLQERYKLAILSDCSTDKAAIIRATVDLSSFKGAYFSCEARLSKADPAFFHMGLAGLGVQAHHCLFVDDTKQNILYAQNVGLQTHLFRNAGELERLLVQ